MATKKQTKTKHTQKTKQSTRGGRRKNAGRKIKFDCETKYVTFLCPITVEKDIKSMVYSYLDKFKIK